MRRLGGLALIVLGLLSVLLGAALAFAFGPDNRMSTGPHRLSTAGQAIVTAPEAIAYSGPRVHLEVTSAKGDRDLFVGVGHDVDVRDFLADTPRSRITTIDIPWDVTATRVPGDGVPRGSAEDLAWWIADAQGNGHVEVTWRLPDTAADVLILAQDGQDGLAVDVTAAVVAPGAFVAALGGVVIGLGLMVFGWAVLSTRVAPRGVHARRADPASSAEPGDAA